MLKKLLITLICIIFPITCCATITPEDNVRKFINNNANSILSIINNDSLNEEEKSAKLTETFLHLMDINWMAKIALAKQWQTLSTEEKTQYMKAYKEYMIELYVPKFKLYNQHTYTITKVENVGKNDEYIVTLMINSPQSPQPIRVSYRLKAKNNDMTDFTIRDWIFEDVSLMFTQRSDFTSTLLKSDIGNLIRNLQNKEYQAVQ
jgi:phospholipid transport system substrate-binding protein